MQQKQYPQNVNTQRMSTAPKEYYIPPQKNNKPVALGLLFLILFGALGTYFLMKPHINAVVSTNTDITNLKSESNTLSNILDMKLCNFIDSDFNCALNQEKKFKRGDTIYLLSKLALQSKDYGSGPKVNLVQKTMVTDNEWKVLTFASQNISQIAPSVGMMNLPLNTRIVTEQNDSAQNLTLTLQILDVNTKQKITKLIQFELV